MDIYPRNYTILSNADIKKRQDDDINQISTLLSISRAASCILLHHYSWNVTKLQDEWFTDENKVRVAAGLPDQPMQTAESTELTCGICLDVYIRDSMAAAACCSHWYCFGCWKGYVEAAIRDGPGCLSLRCPEPSCTVVVGLDMIDNVATVEDRGRYTHHLLRSYVDKNRRIKWCPSPGCEFAAEFLTTDIEGNDVRCNCLHCFCWNCLEESHRPVDCKTAANWVRNILEASNTQWIVLNTKPCPKCNRPIEKIIDKGCKHMTCVEPCRHQFCWVCLGEWNRYHGLNPISNEYENCEEVGFEAVRDEARWLLERCTKNYNLWVSNNNSKLKALDDLRSLQGEKLEELRMKLMTTMISPECIDFVGEAWEQIVECMRVLQWLNVYRYYSIEGGENGSKTDYFSKKDYFEFIQGLAEEVLRKLCQSAEEAMKKLRQCAEEGVDQQEGKFHFEARFNELKLINHTSVARKHFNNLVQSLRTGLLDSGSEMNAGQTSCKPQLDETGTSFAKHLDVAVTKTKKSNFCTTY